MTDAQECYVCFESCSTRSPCPCGAALHLQCHLQMIDHGVGGRCGVCRGGILDTAEILLCALAHAPAFAGAAFLFFVVMNEPVLAYRSLRTVVGCWSLFGVVAALRRAATSAQRRRKHAARAC